KLALARGDFATALHLYRRQTRLRPQDAEIWAGLGYAAFQSARPAEALEAFLHAGTLRDIPQYDYYAGIAAAALGRWDEAVDRFQRSTRRGDDGLTFYGLAMTLEGR